MNIDFQAHMVTPVRLRMVLSVINRGLRMVSAHGLEITNKRHRVCRSRGCEGVCL